MSEKKIDRVDDLGKEARAAAEIADSICEMLIGKSSSQCLFAALLVLLMTLEQTDWSLGAPRQITVLQQVLEECVALMVLSSKLDDEDGDTALRIPGRRRPEDER